MERLMLQLCVYIVHFRPEQLHWLPIKSMIVYKLCLLMHNIHTGLPGRLRVSNGVVIESSAQSALISHCQIR